MIRFARARKRIVLLTAMAALTASAGAVVAALVLTPPAPEPQRFAPTVRDLGVPARMSPLGDADGAPCSTTPGVCVSPSDLGAP